jgi:hypothetical protein
VVAQRECLGVHPHVPEASYFDGLGEQVGPVDVEVLDGKTLLLYVA